MTTRYDAVVVGAGPAGSTAALMLARGGVRVALVEKATPPRHKTCGGGLLARARASLPMDVSAVVERECLAAELHHRGPLLAFSTRRARPIVSMVMRHRFDYLLTTAAQDAGAHLIAGTTVTAAKIGAQDVELQTTAGSLRTELVVAADGVNSAIARHCGLPELTEVIPALEVEMESAQFDRFADAARFDFGVAPRGYAWVFPKRAHLSVGVLTTRRGSCNLNAAFAHYLAMLGLEGGRELARHGYMIPLRPRRELFSRSRVLLVGDAAGLADPVMAEGISAAIGSGQLAADAILAHRGDPVATIAAYRSALEQTWLADLRVARLLAKVLYGWPAIRAGAFICSGQRLAEFMARVVLGESSYRRALCRSCASARACPPEDAGMTQATVL